MRSIIFKRSLIAASLLVACQANAALYRVVESTIPSGVVTISYNDVLGTAIEPSGSDPSCFGTSCTDSQYKLAGEARINDVDGISYREEAPFAMDNAFFYVQTLSTDDERQNELQDYCSHELLYSTCDAWAYNQYLPWKLERENSSNSQGFIEGDTSYKPNSGTTNTVINSLVDTGSVVAVGNSSTASQRNVAFSNNANADITAANNYEQSRAFYSDGTTYTAGSVSTEKTNTYGDNYFSKPAIWDNSNHLILDYGNGDASDLNTSNHRLGQGSIRSFYRDTTGNKLYAVGYDTYNSDQDMNATIFVGDTDDITTISQWDYVPISNVEVDQGGTDTYSNSVLTGVNDQKVAIGTAKRFGSRPSDGAAANRMFIVPDVSASTPTAQFLDTTVGGIFFAGSGGKMGAINNYNEIVGQVDAEDTREVDGKPRRVRGFIYPYNPVDTSRSTIFDNKAWWLDDLTNGGTYSDNNNRYRILNATGINGAGVISATAILCTSDGNVANAIEYSSTNDYATCDGVEKTVAVKLVPIDGATSSDIDAREHSYPKVDKKGGSFGLFGLAALGLFGIRRKLKS